MIHSPIGKTAVEFWLQIEDHYPHAILDEFVVMPDHVHGIIHLFPETKDFRPNRFGPPIPKSLSNIIHQYKSAVTKWARKSGYPNFAWQSRFHDRLIRNDAELERIRKYILRNPAKWWEEGKG